MLTKVPAAYVPEAYPDHQKLRNTWQALLTAGKSRMKLDYNEINSKWCTNIAAVLPTSHPHTTCSNSIEDMPLFVYVRKRPVEIHVCKGVTICVVPKIKDVLTNKKMCQKHNRCRIIGWKSRRHAMINGAEWKVLKGQERSEGNFRKEKVPFSTQKLYLHKVKKGANIFKLKDVPIEKDLAELSFAEHDNQVQRRTGCYWQQPKSRKSGIMPW